ncbi:alpha-L-arabinofuranosidase C-terminal domain-containing protein [Parafilimonas sp.]|uniref:alpha-L-arabinofuranosidase C-terminal domain-containing protein n=1 Tax=Parafilimonas sp. TaxID=1969739 RepID=UPI0039E3081D
MKKVLLSGVLIFSGFRLYAQATPPDSVYLFSYATTRDQGRSGLRFAWSTDKQNWRPIGVDLGFVKSDYGRWGSEKRMIAPFLFQGPNGLWHCIWNLSPDNGAVAYTTTRDMLSWMPQAYYITENDLKIFTPPQIKEERNKRLGIIVSGTFETGTLNKVPRSLVEGMIQKEKTDAYRHQLWNENTKEDAIRFASLKPLTVSLTPQVTGSKKISTLLVGAFFEDINYAADGGLYAELVQNRDFEYAPADKEGRDSGWNSKKAWRISGKGIDFKIESQRPVHPNNQHYAVLKTTRPGGALVNEGFEGIAVKAGENYNFSLCARMLSGNRGKLLIRLADKNGAPVATGVITGITKDWKNTGAVLNVTKTTDNARLEIIPQSNMTIALDMISLFPQKTFKGRKNGLRADLAEAIAELHPKFIRFPGGCVAHGDGIENIYHWKNTVGPLEARKPQRNLWGYHQTAGLGYFEYFQFCEDIGALPLPVVAAGVPCQNSGSYGHPLGGQQGGIPLSDMKAYIQEILDLIEWANGSPATQWGKVRAAAGHPKPFNLKYIGIGNEDLISTVFEERFEMIYNAVKANHPEITVIGTAGPFFEGSDYKEGWRFARKLNVPMLDEHYYVSPAWFIYNQDFYDKYDRSGPKVYLGEYAAHLPGRPNNLETALAEAIHLTALERNGDVVSMSSYAPLLAKEGHTQWNPDMIYFNNTAVKPTTGYYVQQLFSKNAGDQYIPAKAVYSDNNEKANSRFAWSVVKNADHLFLKLVNLLPVSTSVVPDLKDFTIDRSPIIKTVLSGNPDSKNMVPVQTTADPDEIEKLVLPPYSSTVLKIKLHEPVKK